ncbi:CRISPR-associated helicase Cas3' [Mesorhizobium sp. PUT5]|uniref:CRISPR-associated helicase Cas3' n=1 Tax=Mesorhizobium sp. PUT5 TaxID=3454629 RepID=UPI003FA45649
MQPGQNGQAQARPAYYAHSGTPGDCSDWQGLPEHLIETAGLAARFAEVFGLEKAASAAGLFHDLGKYDPEFQRRLTGADIRVDHSTAGAAILQQLARDGSPFDVLMAEIISYAILGHHAGLPDRRTAEPSCFEERCRRFTDSLDPAWRDEIAPDLAGLLPERMLKAIGVGNRHVAFDMSVIARFLFSCLVDADFKNTEEFYAKLENRQVDREWPALGDLLPDYLSRFDTHMAGLPRDGELNPLRRDILAHVRAGAALAPGLFTLTVPTGGGKTLASLGFALDHAKAHGLRRIIYAIPFTSIIDQTATVFRKVLGGEHILEHHSAIEEDEAAARRGQRDFPTSRDKLRLAMEDWAAPVVVTTNVQLFESLFAARTSRARKLHNIAGSIIILDEAQTLPRHLLKPAVRMLDTLARLFGCTIVLCTATQPALGKDGEDGGQGFPDGLDLEGRELAPDPRGLASRLRRARIERVGEMSNEALVAAMRPLPQALVIVNSRRHALELYRQAKEAGLDGLVHLTTRQCAAHRRGILDDARHRLKDGLACRLIATSLIEAGVDVDFPRVWRAEAGWDQITQAAGRCNREGRRPLEDSIVSVFAAPDYPPPREIKSLVEDTVRALDAHQGDIQTLEAMRSFYGEVYWRMAERLDREGIVDALKLDGRETNFAFRDVAQKFRMIESNMEAVIVPFDDKAIKAVDDLPFERIPSGLIARKLQTYIVQVPARARELLIRCGHVAFECPQQRGDQFAVLRTQNLYDPEVGLLWETPEYLALEDTIV